MHRYPHYCLQAQSKHRQNEAELGVSMAQKPPSATQAILEKVIALQDGLIAYATGRPFEDREYQDLRRELLANIGLKGRLPPFIRETRDLSQFWSLIKEESGNYAGRRKFIWDQFRPLIDHLEGEDLAPGVAPITMTLEAFDPEHVHEIWQKALARRTNDPEGAITAARTLLETVCKYILDDARVAYADDTDLPKLWGLVAEELNLAPAQHQENVFKAILGNCQAVVNNLAAIRNRAGDAHGQGRRQVKPKARHAELAVNLAGTMASFLVTTWKEKAVSKMKT
jgi:Abortive infection C-terminus